MSAHNPHSPQFGHAAVGYGVQHVPTLPDGYHEWPTRPAPTNPALNPDWVEMMKRAAENRLAVLLALHEAEADASNTARAGDPAPERAIPVENLRCTDAEQIEAPQPPDCEVTQTKDEIAICSVDSSAICTT